MTSFNDSSPEMHDDSLSPDDVEALLSGMATTPEMGAITTTFAELRRLPETTGTPVPSAALSEFVGVGLNTNPEPLDLNELAATSAPTFAAASTAEPVRRNSMIGQLVAFCGTLGGKVAVGATVAAASVGGVHATGVADVPFLPDTEAAEVETVDMPEDPEAMAFVEDLLDDEDVVDKPAESDLTDNNEDNKDEDDKTDLKEDADKVDDVKDFFPDKELDEDSEENDADEDPEENDETKAEDVEKDVEKDHEKDHDKDVEHDNDKEHDKDEGKDDGGKTPEEEAALEAIGKLDEELHIAKAAVKADAKLLITPLEEERELLLADLEEAFHLLAEEWEPVIEALEIELEAAELEEDRLEIEAEIDAAIAEWISAKAAAELEVDPRLTEIAQELETIELERDEELNRLIQEFLDAVEEIEKNL